MRTVRPTNAMSSAWFHYETSPIKIRYIMTYSSWSGFWVHMCAIIGGAFAMAGIIEKMMRGSLNAAKSITTGKDLDTPTKVSEIKDA